MSKKQFVSAAKNECSFFTEHINEGGMYELD